MFCSKTKNWGQIQGLRIIEQLVARIGNFSETVAITSLIEGIKTFNRLITSFLRSQTLVINLLKQNFMKKHKNFSKSKMKLHVFQVLNE